MYIIIYWYFTSINLDYTASDPSTLPWSAIKLLLRPCLLVTVQPTGAQVEGEEQVQHLQIGVNTGEILES